MRKNLRLASLAAMMFLSAFFTLKAGGGGGGGQPGTSSGNTAVQRPSGTPLNLQWEDQGPNNKGTYGRGIAFDAQGNVFAGSLGGGLFKSTNLGATWVKVPGVSDNQAVSTIAIDGNTIYVGTGERYFFKPFSTLVSSYSSTGADTAKKTCAFMYPQTGEGLYISTDAGATWNHNNATWTPTTPPYLGPFSSTQKVVAKGGKALIGTYAGLYYSTDTLNTVTKAAGTPAFQTKPILDIEFANGNRVFASTADSIYKSDDGGLSFGSGINNSTAFPRDLPIYVLMGGNRLAIAVSPSNPDYVYVTGAGANDGCSGVWRSTDNGDTWALAAPGEVSGNAFAPFNFAGKYNLVLEVSPTNPNDFYVGGNRLYVYTDTTGLVQLHSTFDVYGRPWNYIPASQMGMAFNPANPAQYFVLTDKQIVRTDDGGQTFTAKTKGFNASHAWSVHSSPDYRIIAGETKTGLIYKSNSDFSDAAQQFTTLYNVPGRAAFSLLDYHHVISQGPDLGLVRSLVDGLSWEQFYGVPQDSLHPSLELDSIFINKVDSATTGGNLYDGGGPPVTPWCFDEVIPPSYLQEDSLIKSLPTYIFMCSHHSVWLITSPFGGVDSLPKWSRITKNLVPSGAATPREFLTAITVSGDTNHTVYAATNYGRVYRILNGIDPAAMDVTANISIISDSTLPIRWISDIAVDPNNRSNLLITYGANDSSGNSRVYMTNNVNAAVVTWKSIGTGLPRIPVYTAEFHPDPNNRAILVGTDAGIYSTTDDWDNQSNLGWNEENNNLGKVQVNDIFIRPYYKDNKPNGRYGYAPDYTIYAATNGRGIFQSTDLVHREKDNNGPGANSSADVILYPNPSEGAAFLDITLSERSNVRIELYDFNGRLLKVITHKEFGAGKFTIDFSGQELVSGVYFVSTEVSNSKGEFNKTLKATILK